jgi:hypothetical protein
MCKIRLHTIFTLKNTDSQTTKLESVVLESVVWESPFCEWAHCEHSNVPNLVFAKYSFTNGYLFKKTDSQNLYCCLGIGKYKTMSSFL